MARGSGRTWRSTNLLDCLKPSGHCRSSGMVCREETTRMWRISLPGFWHRSSTCPLRGRETADSRYSIWGIRILSGWENWSNCWRKPPDAEPSVSNFLTSRAMSRSPGRIFPRPGACLGTILRLRSKKGWSSLCPGIEERGSPPEGGLKRFDPLSTSMMNSAPEKNSTSEPRTGVIRILFNVGADADNYNAQSLNAREIALRLDAAHFESTLFFERSPDTRLLRAGIRTVRLPRRWKTIRIFREMMGRYDFIVYIDLSPASYIYLHLPRFLRRATKSVLCIEGPRRNLDGVSPAVRKYADYVVRHADLRTAV